MNTNIFENTEKENTWCPGCGNFSILQSLKTALFESDIKPEELIMVSGIGQAAKTPQYIRSNYFIGLHGRALPVACGIKATQPEKTVIAISGDGCSYGEGGNHFMNAIRRNSNIVHIVHNNMIYGLTKGQASPTTQTGIIDPLHPEGVKSRPLNPLRIALDCGAGFVARCFSGNIKHTTEIIKKAIKFNGYALIDIFQPCVSFNKTQTFKWYKDNTEILGENYKPDSMEEAWKIAGSKSPYYLGILYKNNFPDPCFEEEFSYMSYPLQDNIRKKDISIDILNSLK